MRTCRSLLLSFLCLARLLEPSTAFVSLQRSALISVTKASTASSSSKLNSFGDFKGIAKFFQPDKQDAKPIRPKYETVIIEPDFRVGGLFLAFGGLLDTIPYIQLFVGPFVTLLGVLFVVQGFRVRFIFDNEALELATVGDSKGELKSSGENIVVGGANRWATDTIVNYDFFPKGWIDGPVGPILIYFKETQTDSKNWNDGPGAKANDPDLIAAGKAVAGQVHFFPAICNAQQMREQFEKRQCGKIES